MMNKETDYDRHERLMQPIRDAQAKTKSKTIPIKELLENIQSTLEHIVRSDAWDMLDGSSAEDMIKEIEIKLKEQD